MKLMIAADIHGSSYYCEKLLKRYGKEQADRLLLLGDILYHGPRNDLPYGYNPKETARMLNENKNELLCVRGNCDSEVDQMVLEFPIMAEYCLLDICGVTIFATHGHHFGSDNLPPHKEGDILLCGHTHIPACEQKEGMIYVNPGSISIPKENSVNSYMIFHEKTFFLNNLNGEILQKFYI